MQKFVFCQHIVINLKPRQNRLIRNKTVKNKEIKMLFCFRKLRLVFDRPCDGERAHAFCEAEGNVCGIGVPVCDKIRSCRHIGHKKGEDPDERICPVFFIVPVFHAKLSAHDVGAVLPILLQRQWMKRLDAVGAGVGEELLIDKPADLCLRNVELVFNDERHFAVYGIKNLGECGDHGV